jgi:hypothetical protein
MQSLKYLRPLSWEEAFSMWEKGEANLPRWIEHYTKRGFSSWKEWRQSSVESLHPEKLTWSLFEITDNTIVQDFYAGPFRAWQEKYYEKERIVPFDRLVENPELQKDANINEVISNFPKGSTLVGLQKDGKIIIIEGMHRCCALAVAFRKGQPIDAKLFIALAEFSDSLPMLGQANSPT